MKYLNFEKHIQSSFADDAAYVDTEALIASIHGEKRPRRFPFWLLTSGVLLAITVGYMVSPMLSKKFNLSQHDSSITPAFGHSLTTSASSTHILQNTEQNHTNLSQQTNSHTISTSTPNEGPSSKNTKSVNFINDTSNPTKSNDQNSTGPMLAPASNHASLTHTTDQVYADKSRFDNLNPQTIFDDQKQDKAGVGTFASIGYMPMRPIHTLTLPMTTLGKNKEILCPTFKRKNKLNFAIVPEIGYFKAIKTLDDKVPTAEVNDLLSLRQKDEKTRDGLQLALYLQLMHSSYPSWYIRPGVQYTRISETMKYKYTDVRQDTTFGIISITKSPSGDTITTIYGDIITEVKTTGTRIRSHYINSLDIPISIGYQYPFTSFYVNTELGLNINISNFSSGKMLTAGSNFIDLSQTPMHKKNVGLSVFGSIGIEKPIDQNLSVYACLRGRYVPSDYALKENPISQKYSMIGLHVGSVMRF